MSFFFFYQQAGGEEVWSLALAESRDAIVRDKKPRFVTVLDVDAPVDSSFSVEQLNACRYKGSFYADFDGDLGEVIERVKEFAGKIKDQGVDLNTVRWFSTGGRGLHAEIPMACFVDKPSPKGYQFLPAIYKEMIFDVFVDTIDLRVYSARKGRMWRTPGVQRDNGLYKVPLTAPEVLALTVESYLALSAAPRHVEVAAPVFAHGLAVIFAKAQAKIETNTKNKKSGEADKKILLKFGGKFPPSLEKIMQGAATREGSGFHNIALQIAVTANALGKSEEETLKACEGLFESHVSEGTRYNTPARRKVELQRLLRYTDGNPCYEFAKGAIKAICEKDADTSDLDGATESAGAEVASSTEEDNGLLGSVSMRENGIFVKDQEGIIKAISNLSFEDVSVLKSLPQGEAPSEVWGFESIVKVRGKASGRKRIPNEIFATKAKFNTFAMSLTGMMSGSDNQTTAITQLLHQQAEKNMQVKYVLLRQGLDYIWSKDSNRYDLVYVGGDVGKVGWGREDEEPPYIYQGITGQALFNSTLMDEPLLSGTEHEEHVIRAMLKMNDPAPLMKLIGWLTACFHRQLYHEYKNQFPICQIYGQAGAGKSQTTQLLNQLHYGTHDRISSFSAKASTSFGLERYVIGSASIPTILDEYKPRELLAKIDGYRTTLRSVYQRDMASKGGGAKDYRVLTQELLSGPVMFLAEAIEAQTAIMERCVVINMSKGGIYGRKEYFDTVFENKDVLSRLGKTILTLTMTLPVDEGVKHFAEKHVNRQMGEARVILGPEAGERPMYNLGVALAGFDFFAEVVRRVFGTKLDAELNHLRESVTDVGSPGEEEEVRATRAAESVNIMAEASKVMDTLAFISRTEEGFSQTKLEIGKEYAFAKQGSDPCVDLKMKDCYIKYVIWCKAKNQQALYDNEDQFVAGLASYDPRCNLLCLDSKLVDPKQRQKIYRFSLAKLTKEGVGLFKGA